jgi:hypothetical protein
MRCGDLTILNFRVRMMCENVTSRFRHVPIQPIYLGQSTVPGWSIRWQDMSSRCIRLALFSGNYNCVTDGAAVVLNRLVAFLERQGVDVLVFSPTIDRPAFEPASWRIPLGRVNWAIPNQVPLHNWAMAALAGYEGSTPGPLMASETLAIATAGLLRRPDIIAAAKEELAQRTETARLGAPELGAVRTMTQSLETFWDGSWQE